MSNICVRCDKKIGLFKTPIEGAYCSYDCRNAHRADIERATALAAERERARRDAPPVSRTVARAPDPTPCPKCGQAWRVSVGGGPVGASHGSCDACGFVAAFVAVEPCGTCRQTSMVMKTAAEGRCPRCKNRSGRYRRLSA